MDLNQQTQQSPIQQTTRNNYSTLIIRIGLGLVFLANVYTAFFSPDELSEIIGNSFLAGFLPISPELFIKLIGISDGIVSILLLLGIGLKYVSTYATLWIMGVMAVIGLKELGTFMEHFGPLAMALYIFTSLTSKHAHNNSPHI